MKKDKMKDYVTHYQFYDSKYNPLTKTGKERMIEIENILKIYVKKGEGKALDLCCGMGVSTFAIERLGYNVIGIDVFREYIQRAKKYRKRFKSSAMFFFMDAEELNFEDRTFDIVTLLGNPLPHFSIDHLNSVFKESYRVLKKMEN